MADALRTNTPLTTLHLRNNDIGDEGTGGIAIASQRNLIVTHWFINNINFSKTPIFC